MENMPQWFPFVIPLILVELGLKGVALADLVRRERARGPKWLWVLVILLINLIGPIVYLVFGRGE
jgi:hypothetical protein